MRARRDRPEPGGRGRARRPRRDLRRPGRDHPDLHGDLPVPAGSGHAMKLVNNLLNTCNRFAALEAVRLGQACGMEQDTVVEVLNKSSGRNYATEYTFPTLLSGASYKLQGFTLELMRKDVHLALELAEGLGHRAPVGKLAESLADEAIARFGPGADQSQMMAEWYED